MAQKYGDMLIIITSDEPWSDVWHTQLHYANQLSRYFRVIYLDPPAPWKLKNIFGIKNRKKNINPRLTVIPYHNLLPVSLGKFARWINDVYNEAHIMQFDLLRSFKLSRKMVWHFDPFRAYYFFRRNKKVYHVYHVVDPYYSHDLDSNLSKLANVVVVTSPKFLPHYQSLSSNAILVKQGVDMSFYKSLDAKSNVFIKEYNKNVVLLGTLTDHIDFRILHEILVQTDVKLVIIGPDKISDPVTRDKFTALCTHARCEWLGTMTPADYKPYLEMASVGIIAYKIEPGYINNQRSPLKVISYLAASLPVITNIDSEIPELAGKAIYYEEDPVNFVKMVKLGLSGSLTFDNNSVNEYLNSIDYPVLLERIFRQMGLKLPAPVEN